MLETGLGLVRPVRAPVHDFRVYRGVETHGWVLVRRLAGRV
jgi:hypothetical protein